MELLEATNNPENYSTLNLQELGWQDMQIAAISQDCLREEGSH